MQTLLTILIIVIQILYIPFGNCQVSTNKSCNSNIGETGSCVYLEKCPEAIKLIKEGKHPKICGFNGTYVIVCCETKSISMANIQGSIARKKCIEYNGYDIALQFSIEGGISISPTLGIGGENASPLEFPHMAILGYGDVDNITWQCGGSLISERFVLTAAHCIDTRLGRVRHVKLGAHLLNTTNKHEQTFSVKEVHTYPEYVKTRAYHDIALIELDHTANIQDGIKPACLHTVKELPKRELTATGWGAVRLYGGIHNTLQKFKLQHVPLANCSSYYHNQKTLNNGVIDDWQICADGGGERIDTCQGDSGGPLQTTNAAMSFYRIVGIVSTGLKCAVVPGIYTRVSHYVPWIESIVWPNEL